MLMTLTFSLQPKWLHQALDPKSQYQIAISTFWPYRHLKLNMPNCLISMCVQTPVLVSVLPTSVNDTPISPRISSETFLPPLTSNPSACPVDSASQIYLKAPHFPLSSLPWPSLNYHNILLMGLPMATLSPPSN